VSTRLQTQDCAEKGQENHRGSIGGGTLQVICRFIWC